MDTKHTKVIVAIIIIAAVLFGFVYLQRIMHVSDSSEEWANVPAEPSNEVPERVIVTAKHAYTSDGKHIIAGEYNLPTPCHVLETKYTLAEGNIVVIDFVVQPPAGDQVCAQVVTPVRYKLTISAPKDVKFVARENGKEIVLNLIEAAPGENLENFELYIKG